ncbi:hypothetical protein [Gemmobacter sp.]|uniref:hypothetical protein n=1 Tax=Gemmobacter sp. TaxID=1898957 RepID=UPI002AFEBE2A|nr:hypothetical protein [Gemmobacter sp.]
MAIEKYIGRPRFTRPSYRDRYAGKVTVDDEGRVFLFGTEEVSPIMLESRFHFFEAETGADWPKVRAHHGLPKTKRHSCYSLVVTSLVIAAPLPEEFPPLTLPVLEGVYGCSGHQG